MIKLLYLLFDVAVWASGVLIVAMVIMMAHDMYTLGND